MNQLVGRRKSRITQEAPFFKKQTLGDETIKHCVLLNILLTLS